MPAFVGRYLGPNFRATEALNKERILALLLPRPAGALLDCGCGDGEFTVRLGAAAGVDRLYGVESVEERAAAAEARGIRVSRTDLDEGLPHDDASLDVVHANQLIEHLANPDRFLREIRRVLRPDGYAVLSTNNLASWHNVVSLVLGVQPPPMHVSTEVILGNPIDPFRGHRFAAPQDSHHRIFSFGGLRDLCEHHGFRVPVLTSAGFYPFPPALARILSRLDRRHGVFLIARLEPDRA